MILKGLFQLKKKIYDSFSSNKSNKGFISWGGFVNESWNT